MLDDLPPFAAWRQTGVVDGFEVVYARGGVLRGHVAAVEDGRPHAVRYEIEVDDGLRTRSAHVVTETSDGVRTTMIAADGEGCWTVDGSPAPQLDGLLDIDLEASALTNAFPVRRLSTPVGEDVEAVAAYVRVHDPVVSRLEQVYRRLDDRRFDYRSEGGFRAEITYDASGLVADYPGIATRTA